MAFGETRGRKRKPPGILVPGDVGRAVQSQIKVVKTMNVVDFHQAFNKLVGLTKEEVDQIAQDKSQNVFVHALANRLVACAHDWRAMDPIIDRLLGPVKEKKKENELSYLTDEEIDRELIETVKLIEEEKSKYDNARRVKSEV